MTDRPVLLEDEPYTTKDATLDDNEAMHKAMEMKQASNRYEHLDSLKVDDSQLVGKLTYDQLTLYEKKSVLVSLTPALIAFELELIPSFLFRDRLIESSIRW